MKKAACPILVCGATGRQGGAVARQLLLEGWPVYALTRNPQGRNAKALQKLGAIVVKGDLGDPDSLEQAMAGKHGVFAVTEYWEHGFDAELAHGKNLIAAATKTGVDHFVFSSVGATDRTAGLGIRHFDSKAAIEACLQASPLEWTILRPVTFLENFVSQRFRRNICNRGVLQFGIEPDKPFQMIAMSDLAAFAVKAFSGPEGWKGKSVELASDAFTLPEMAAVLSEKLHRPVQYRYLKPWLQKLIAGYVELRGQSGHYKIAHSLVAQFRWNNASPHGGWAADLDTLRGMHPGLISLREWVAGVDWQPR